MSDAPKPKRKRSALFEATAKVSKCQRALAVAANAHQRTNAAELVAARKTNATRAARDAAVDALATAIAELHALAGGIAPKEA